MMAQTIAAIATPPGHGGIGVVRLSGSGLIALAQALTGRPDFQPRPRYACRAQFLDADAAVLDTGLLLYFPAPHSYTGEDVLELQGHGGPAVMHALLRRCLALGAQLAEPGEFTRRAFLNNKLDLAQAEAVADTIAAVSEQALRSAQRVLQGEFSRAVHKLADGLTEVRALIEALIDFPEEETAIWEETQPRIDALHKELAELLARAQHGRMLSQGLRVVLAGKPNVGKSSLLNRLAGAERAIVTEHPGTTRDAVHAPILIEGVPLVVVDTAGVRVTEDAIEQIGIARTREETAQADLLLLVTDARDDLAADLSEIRANLAVPPHLPCLYVRNKSDLAPMAEAVPSVGPDGDPCVAVSAKTGDGMDRLRQHILAQAGYAKTGGEDALLAQTRHIEALQQVAAALALAQAQHAAPELCAEELRLAQHALGRITGAVRADDLLGVIFSRFCLGK